ncbi:cytochrome C biogenesis protein [Candidatus Peregrinibacteria bacterium]|nr:cytochrome C biogenesis protein [Candidatus Peregrinibacteria bacterium]
MELLIPSFLAGILTVLAPCVIALLPVILGGSLSAKDARRPIIIVGSLGISVIIFTLLLKASTVLIGIPQSFWSYFSGGLILIFGLTMAFPKLWNFIAFKLHLHKSDNLLSKSAGRKGPLGAVLLGASLGPVFTTCSPTYALILAVVLPQNFAVGFLNLIVYTVGMLIPLLIIGYSGQRITRHLRFAVNPNGIFKRLLGTLLIITGLAIFTGYDKVLEAKILDTGYTGPINIEKQLIEK